MKQVLVPFTTGVEEIELVAVVDILRRAGVAVLLASLDGKAVTGRSNITIKADAGLADVTGREWDMVVLPGGLPNAHLLRDSSLVRAVIARQAEQRKTIAAICAAPTALAAYGITKGKRVTSYPSFQQEMEQLQPSSIYVDDCVVADDFLITSRGAGTAVEFALYLVQVLCGQQKADEIRHSIIA